MSARGSCLTQFGGLAVGRQEEQRQYFRDRRIYTLQVESTDACPQGCIYCYAGSTPCQTRGLTATEIRVLLKDAARIGVRAVDWLGGDPLTRRDWYELMVCARSLGLTNNVWTSGLPLGNRDVARKLVDVTAGGFVSVHVDSIVPDTYARLHRGGNTPNIARIVRGADHMLAAGKQADQMINCITYTSLQTAADAIETMRWWLTEKGMRTCLTMFNPAGMGAELRSLAPARDQNAQVYRERDTLNYGAAGGTIAAMDVDKFYCGTMATVTFTGDVTPCSVIRRGVGNIRTMPLARIVAEHGLELVHDRLHDERSMPAPCNACRHNDHCWGCRANALHYGGDANGADPKCWVVRELPATRCS